MSQKEKTPVIPDGTGVLIVAGKHKGLTGVIVWNTRGHEYVVRFKNGKTVGVPYQHVKVKSGVI